MAKKVNPKTLKIVIGIAALCILAFGALRSVSRSMDAYQRQLEDYARSPAGQQSIAKLHALKDGDLVLLATDKGTKLCRVYRLKLPGNDQIAWCSSGKRGTCFTERVGDPVLDSMWGQKIREVVHYSAHPSRYDALNQQILASPPLLP